MTFLDTIDCKNNFLLNNKKTNVQAVFFDGMPKTQLRMNHVSTKNYCFSGLVFNLTHLLLNWEQESKSD